MGHYNSTKNSVNSNDSTVPLIRIHIRVIRDNGICGPIASSENIGELLQLQVSLIGISVMYYVSHSAPHGC